MDKICRIKKRFNITGCRFIYIVEINSDTVIRIGDIFKDLSGNRFRLIGIEMFHRSLAEINKDYQEVGVRFELIDRKEVQGDLLFMDSTK